MATVENGAFYDDTYPGSTRSVANIVEQITGANLGTRSNTDFSNDYTGGNLFTGTNTISRNRLVTGDQYDSNQQANRIGRDSISLLSRLSARPDSAYDYLGNAGSQFNSMVANPTTNMLSQLQGKYANTGSQRHGSFNTRKAVQSMNNTYDMLKGQQFNMNVNENNMANMARRSAFNRQEQSLNNIANLGDQAMRQRMIENYAVNNPGLLPVAGGMLSSVGSIVGGAMKFIGG